MTTSAAKACSDCGGTVTEIRLIDKGFGHGSHQDLEYALAEAKRGVWTSQFPVEGKVAAFMCGQCGRISLYGNPRAAS